MNSKPNQQNSTTNNAHQVPDNQLKAEVAKSPYVHLLNARSNGARSAQDVAAEIIAAGKKRRGEI